MAKYKLKDLCEFITDGTHQTPEYCENGGIKFLSSKDVVNQKIDWNHVKYIPKSLHEKLYKRLSPRLDDILLAKNGTTGVAAIVDRDEIFDVYVSLAVLRPLNIVYPKYLLYAINSQITKRQFNAGLKGVGVPNLHLSVIRETWINVVSKEKQKKICNILDKIKLIIDLENQKLNDLDELIQGRFVEMFGDPIINNMSWPESTIGEGCFVTKLAGFEYSKYIKYGDTGDVVMVKAQNVKNGTLNRKDLSFISNEVSDALPRSQLLPGDVVMTYVGANIGDVALIDDKYKYHLAPNVAKIRVDTKIYNSVYFMYMLMFLNSYIVKNSADTAKAALGMERIRKLKVFIPTYDLQNQFAAFVQQINKSKFEVQKSLEKTQLLFDSLMQEYFG